jgi:hypothetical protein
MLFRVVTSAPHTDTASTMFRDALVTHSARGETLVAANALIRAFPLRQ